jgi:Transposase zinc-binding domain
VGLKEHLFCSPDALPPHVGWCGDRVSVLQAPAPVVYRRRRPEATALYELVRDNLETLYGAIGDGALAVRIPKHARKELEGYLDWGLLCRGFARLLCEGCGKRRLVAFSCKGRGFCPSCTGRRMNATAANLIERVLPPQSGLRQWVLTFPFSWRRRLDSHFEGPLAPERIDGRPWLIVWPRSRWGFVNP